MRFSFHSAALALAFLISPEVIVAGEFDRRIEPQTIEEGLELVRREYGKKNFESFHDGDVILVRVRDKQSQRSYSPQVSEIGRLLGNACVTEFGGRYRDTDGRIKLKHNVASTGAGHVVNLVSVDGDAYLQQFRPLVDAAIVSVQDESEFSLVHKSNDPVLRGGHRRSDRLQTCFRHDREAMDDGERLKMIISSKYVDEASNRYVALVLHGDALTSMIARVRSENTEFAAEFATAKAAEDKRKADARQAEHQKREREKAEQALREEKFRANLAIGDNTQCGYVIEVRSPMVEVAVSTGSQWFHIEDLVPADTKYSYCPDDELRSTGQGDRVRSTQVCEAERATCLATCDSQMTTTDISAPGWNIVLCRKRCEQITCSE